MAELISQEFETGAMAAIEDTFLTVVFLQADLALVGIFFRCVCDLLGKENDYENLNRKSLKKTHCL